MTRRPVAYVAHPIGGDVAGNLARALRWLRWLIDRHPTMAFSVPWHPYCLALDNQNNAHRARGIEDDLAVLARCEVIVLVGGRLSPGMSIELDRARVLGLEVIDYLDLGAEPPPEGASDR
jgi:hypothetical protein